MSCSTSQGDADDRSGTPHQEIPLRLESDHGFLTLLGNHGDLALAVQFSPFWCWS